MLRLTCLLFLLAACSDAPDLPGGIDPALADAAYPTLVPVEQILGPAPVDPAADAQVTGQLDARIAALQARAERLRGDRIDPATRKRMQDGVAQP